ncbi:MAG TPA: hypothetical protein VGD71_00645 [Kribbella sp.]
MESLDDVIDAMIADRVIHRHRRKWLIAIALVVVLALVILVTGGWKEKKGRTVDTVQAPTTLEAGRFEFGISNARIVRTKKTTYDPAKASLVVSMEVKNIDSETKASNVMSGNLLQMVPGPDLIKAMGKKELIKSNGATCHGELNYVFVYGLPAQSCTAKFDIPANFSAKEIEVGVLAEQFISDDELTGASGDPYWQNETPWAVVRVPTTIEVAK